MRTLPQLPAIQTCRLNGASLKARGRVRRCIGGPAQGRGTRSGERASPAFNPRKPNAASAPKGPFSPIKRELRSALLVCTRLAGACAAFGALSADPTFALARSVTCVYLLPLGPHTQVRISQPSWRKPNLKLKAGLRQRERQQALSKIRSSSFLGRHFMREMQWSTFRSACAIVRFEFKIPPKPSCLVALMISLCTAGRDASCHPRLPDSLRFMISQMSRRLGLGNLAPMRLLEHSTAALEDVLGRDQDSCTHRPQPCNPQLS